jgi:hypothetical protein
MNEAEAMLFAVIPETPQALSGILQGGGACHDPVSAQQHFMPQRARDDGGRPSSGARRKTRPQW